MENSIKVLELLNREYLKYPGGSSILFEEMPEGTFNCIHCDRSGLLGHNAQNIEHHPKEWQNLSLEDYTRIEKRFQHSTLIAGAEGLSDRVNSTVSAEGMKLDLSNLSYEELKAWINRIENLIDK